MRVEQVQQFPTIEFFRTVPLLSLVRFGEWDAILAEPAPHADLKFFKRFGTMHGALLKLRKAIMLLQSKVPATLLS